MKRLELFGLEGIAEIDSGDSIGALICDGCARQGIELIGQMMCWWWRRK
jgi:hypothetical protein